MQRDDTAADMQPSAAAKDEKDGAFKGNADGDIEAGSCTSEEPAAR